LETGQQARRRFETAVDRIIAETGQASPMVVSHGTVICLFLARRLGMDGFAIWQELGLPAFIELELPGLTLTRMCNHMP
jgi:broad specificity phosphatase PhoE